MPQNNAWLTLWSPEDLNADLISMGGHELRCYHLNGDILTMIWNQIIPIKRIMKKIHSNLFNADTKGTHLIVCIMEDFIL